MGSFSQRCAVSNLPISAGDKVLWVYSKYDGVQSTRNIADIVWRYADSMEKVKEYELKNLEFAAKYPSEDPLWGSYWLNPPKNFEWGFGEYDDYGWVADEDDLPEEYYDNAFMIRKDVADRLAEYGKTRISSEWENRMPFLADNYLYCVLLVCNLTRINVFGRDTLGRQYPDSEEMKEQALVHKIIGDELRKLTNQIRLEELEYANWSFWVLLEAKLRRFIKRFHNV